MVNIPIAGPLADSEAEVSGLAWYGEQLILLPQYPRKMGGNLFALSKGDILALLDGELDGPLLPRPIPFSGPELAKLVPGYDGLEALAFNGNQVFFTIEADRGEVTGGYLVDGYFKPDLSGLVLDGTILAELPQQVPVHNHSDETLLVAGDSVITIFELNGADLNPAPLARRFQVSLSAAGSLEFPQIPYRITDATAVDSSGRFWVINYFWPGEREIHAGVRDPFWPRFGQGSSHAAGAAVERLIELRLDGDVIRLTGTPPIQLQLRADGESRNWEGLVRLDDRGFLIVSDEYPRPVTLLGFVPYPPVADTVAAGPGAAGP